MCENHAACIAKQILEPTVKAQNKIAGEGWQLKKESLGTDGRDFNMLLTQKHLPYRVSIGELQIICSNRLLSEYHNFSFFFEFKQSPAMK